jgi:2'-5' RNA ligase
LPEQEWCVEGFTLFQSVLMPQGARHSVVQRFSLAQKEGCYGRV